MPQFRNKPVVIDAWRWKFDPSQEESPSWINDALNIWPKERGIAFWPDGNRVTGHVWENTPHIAVHTVHGVMAAMPGDWIIRHSDGDLGVLANETFEAKYEPA
jgi:hypothetical protein